MYKQIMMAHDLSAEADLALVRAQQLAQQHKARLTVVHCVAELQATTQQQIEQQIRHAQQSIAGAFAHPLQVLVKVGQPSIKLAELVRAYTADLLVVGQHHQSSPAGFAGTTLEHLLQKIKTPVLLVAQSVSSAYQQALVAMDFSQAASRAFQHGLRLLPEDAQLAALHICEMAELSYSDVTASELEWQQQLFAQLISDECQLAKQDAERIQQQVLQGELYNCLEQALAQYQPQLIALGRQGRGEMADALVGSVAQSFLADPPCDVLVVS